MAPPVFGDIGKNANDVFKKGYNTKLIKVDAKATTKSDVEFKTTCSPNLDTGRVDGHFETKYKFSDYGLIVTEKWKANNVFTTEIQLANQLTEGLDLSFNVSTDYTAGVKSTFKNDNLALTSELHCGSDGTTSTDTIVFGDKGWFAGLLGAFNLSKSTLTKHNFVLGYSGDDFSCTLNEGTDYGDEANPDNQELSASVHKKLSDRLDAAVSLTWSSGYNSHSFAMGGRYNLNDDVTINAKVNNRGHIGLAYIRKLKDGIKMNVSTMLDAKNFDAPGGLKVGFGFEFEA